MTLSYEVSTALEIIINTERSRIGPQHLINQAIIKLLPLYQEASCLAVSDVDHRATADPADLTSIQGTSNLEQSRQKDFGRSSEPAEESPISNETCCQAESLVVPVEPKHTKPKHTKSKHTKPKHAKLKHVNLQVPRNFGSTKLWETIERHRHEISELLGKCVCEFLDVPKPARHIDYKIRDLLTKNNSKPLAVCQNAGRRNLALEYCGWSKKVHKVDRLELLYEKRNSDEVRTKNQTDDFIALKKVDQESRSTIATDIRIGMKLLILEKITSQKSFLVITCFSVRDFRDLAYCELDSLAAFLSSPESQMWFGTTAEGWSGSYLSEYTKKGSIPRPPCSQCGKSWSKKRKLVNNGQTNKRKLRKTHQSLSMKDRKEARQPQYEAPGNWAEAIRIEGSMATPQGSSDMTSRPSMDPDVYETRNSPGLPEEEFNNSMEGSDRTLQGFPEGPSSLPGVDSSRDRISGRSFSVTLTSSPRPDRNVTFEGNMRSTFDIGSYSTYNPPVASLFDFPPPGTVNPMRLSLQQEHTSFHQV